MKRKRRTQFSICMYQYFKKSPITKKIIDDNILAMYPLGYDFKLTNKRRLWHIKRNNYLLRWLQLRGVKI